MIAPLPPRQVVAHNDAVDSGNPMHVDESARAMGFKAALVPGVTVYGYMTHQAIRLFGDEWLEHGSMRVRFRQPVFAGDTLTITTEKIAGLETDQAVALNVTDPAQVVCVTGTAGPDRDAAGVITDERWPQMDGSLPPRPLPQPRWPAEHEYFEPGTSLGSITATFPKKAASAFLKAMQDDHPVFGDAIHPAWLLRQANMIVDRNYELGPWIHTESEVRHFGVAGYDRPIEIRARVLSTFERRGNHYADLDVVLLDGGAPDGVIMRVMHRVIYRVKPAA